MTSTKKDPVLVVLQLAGGERRTEHRDSLQQPQIF
ncbi:MAG: hypothetical protein Ct9H300mP11_29330 [Chloroflexota bacterium]|nr:MAG: hypothetical protein Ct9H300mP11_29330 [Chloroflexota bacterium]